MATVLLVRGYAEHDFMIWLLVLGLIVLMLGGRWLAHVVQHYVQHRRLKHLWPFR